MAPDELYSVVLSVSFFIKIKKNFYGKISANIVNFTIFFPQKN